MDPKDGLTAVVFEVLERGEVIGRITLEHGDRAELADILRGMASAIDAPFLKGAELRGALQVLGVAKPRRKRRPVSA